MTHPIDETLPCGCRVYEEEPEWSDVLNIETCDRHSHGFLYVNGDTFNREW